MQEFMHDIHQQPKILKMKNPNIWQPQQKCITYLLPIINGLKKHFVGFFVQKLTIKQQFNA